MKKMLSLLLVICMTMVACVPSAYAARGPDIALKTVPYTGLEEIENAIPLMDEEDEIVPLITIAEGANAFLAKITIYPGYIDDGNIKYAPSLGNSVTFPDNYYGGSLRLSPTQTQEVLAEFLNGTGRSAELWYVDVQYNVYTDRWGSYGKYFEFYTYGDMIFPNKQSNGTVRYNLTPNTADQECHLYSAFKIPEDKTAYYFGFNGGFWYFNYLTNKTLSHDINAYVYIGYAN